MLRLRQLQARSYPPPPPPGHLLQMPHSGVSSYVQMPTVGLLEECKRPNQTALSRVTDDQRSNLTDSIIQLSEKDRYHAEIILLKMRPSS